MAAPDNYLGIEPLIVTYWQAAVPALADRVFAIGEAENVEKFRQFTPGGLVYYDGYSIASKSDKGKANALDQLWVLVVQVRNVRDARSGAPARVDAGELISDTIDAFVGWQPDAGYREFQLAPSNYKPSYLPGYAYFPLTFSTRLFL